MEEKINYQYSTNIKRNVYNLSSSQMVLRVSLDGICSPEKEELLVEHQLNVYVNEVFIMSLFCTPTNMEELIIGHLFSNGIIRSLNEIEYLYLCETGNTAKIFLKEEVEGRNLKPNMQIPTCCTKNRIYWRTDEHLEPLTPITWKKEWVFRLVKEFEKDTDLHQKTRGTHSSFLAREGEILFCSEDIGRHNAIDKVIGMGIKNNIDLSKTMIFTSGRVPTDMVEKVVRARIPVFISKAAPTKQSVEMAEHYGMTLIAEAKSGIMKIYSGDL